jgi:predicted phosphodiesterase
VRRASAASVGVFALEPTAAQLIVRSPDGTPRVHVGDAELPLELADGIGAIVADGLAPATVYPLRLDGDVVGEVRTLSEPPGRYLGRFATVSDLHVGETGFGHAPRLRMSSDPATAHPVICLRAAVAELDAWGAEQLIVKGDVTHKSRAREYEIAARVLTTFPRPLHVMQGNHDGGNHRHDPPRPALARHGITLVDRTTPIAVGGLNVLLANTVHTGHEHGYAPPDDDPIFDLAASDGPAFVVLHHQLMTTRIPYYLPPGIPQPSAERFLVRLAAANPASFVTTGHTHRHRRRTHGPVVVTEVGSVKDHPGTWAGYLVYEGGLVQTVRRIMDPRALAWTERTRVSAMGAWGRWSPGRRSDRSFSHPWPHS